MAFHPSFPSIEVTSVPTQGKFYQPKSGDGAYLIGGEAYLGLTQRQGADIISASAYNKANFAYALPSPYNCKNPVNPDAKNALVAFCPGRMGPLWIPELASRAEPEAYVVTTDPKTGTTTIPSSTPAGTGTTTTTTKKTPWKVIGLTVLGVVAVGFVMLRHKGKK